MATAYKCNHCGKCYDPEEYPSTPFVTINQLWVVAGGEYNNHQLGGRKALNYFSSLDFCDQCSKELAKLIMPKEKTKEEKKNEKQETKSVDADDASDIRDTLNQFINSLESGGRRIIREYIDSICSGEASERKGGAEQKSDS